MQTEKTHAYIWFLLPAMLLIALFKVYPIISGIYDSFFQFSFVSKSHYFVGFQNYLDALTDSVFQNSLKVTFLFNILVNPIQVFLSFGLALLLTAKVKGQRFFRTLHLIPITVSFTISCILWGVLLNPDVGLLNSILNEFGIPNQPFLTDKSQALASIIGIATWKGVGYWALFFIAGLEDIPRQLYEAANIDGSGWWKTFIHITIPQMRKVLLFVVISDTIANFLLFAPSYILTNGGPEGSTDFVMFEIFKNAYRYSNTNLASAMIVILLVLLLAIVLVENILLKSKE